MEMKSMEDGMVIVTGASRGVGRETVLALCRAHQVPVMAIARDEDALDRLMEEGEGRVEGLVLDIAAPGAAEQVKRKVAGRRVRGLIHNAGLLHHRPMGQHKRADLEQLYAVNVLAPLELSQALVPELAGDPPGHIVHIGSMGGFPGQCQVPGPGGLQCEQGRAGLHGAMPGRGVQGPGNTEQLPRPGCRGYGYAACRVPRIPRPR
jgi:short-subunit dehydrogenase